MGDVLAQRFAGAPRLDVNLVEALLIGNEGGGVFAVGVDGPVELQVARLAARRGDDGGDRGVVDLDEIVIFAYSPRSMSCDSCQRLDSA